MRDPTLLGAVLAGGASRRFGSPKALVPFQGEPMVLRTLRKVREATGGAVVVTSVPAVTRALEEWGIRALPDREPGAGPLAGLHAALHHARDRGMEGVLLVACDMPLVSGTLLARLAREGRSRGRPAAVPLGESGRPEPLCAWYSLECLPAVERRLVGADRSMTGLLEELDPWTVPLDGPYAPSTPGGPSPAGSLQSANTPEELRRLEALGAKAHPGNRAPLPPAVLVVGFKDSGKTTVAVKLAAELRAQGLRVGALKHGHGFRLDTPGTDSWRLANEGAADPVLLAGPKGFALIGGWGEGGEPPLRNLLAAHFPESDVVVVEGYKGEAFPRIEVHRTDSGRPPLCLREVGEEKEGPFLALVVDDPEGVGEGVPVPVLDRDDPELAPKLAALVEDQVMNRGTKKAARR